MGSGIPKGEFRSGWIDGEPRRRRVYVTWAQIQQYHTEEEALALDRWFRGKNVPIIEGETTMCFCATDYLTWLHEMETQGQGTVV